MEEIDDKQNVQHTSHISVFDRIGTSSSSISVFNRLGDLAANEDFSPPRVGYTLRESAFKRLGAPNQIREIQTTQIRGLIFS